MKILKVISVVALFAAIIIANIANLTIDNKSFTSLNTLLHLSSASAEDPPGPGLCEQVIQITTHKIVIEGDPNLPDGIYLEKTTIKDCWDNGTVLVCTSGNKLEIINIAGKIVFLVEDFTTIIGC